MKKVLMFYNYAINFDNLETSYVKYVKQNGLSKYMFYFFSDKINILFQELYRCVQQGWGFSYQANG